MSAGSTLDPSARSFTPARQDSPGKFSAGQTAGKAPKPIEEGDIGCFLCDDGLRCPICSPNEDAHPGTSKPKTPVAAKRQLELEQFSKTPGHEWEAQKHLTMGEYAKVRMKQSRS